MPITAKLLPPRHFYLAYSSGVDSVACAHYLKKKGANFSLFHFNHNFQEINTEMEERARKFATQHDLPIIIKTVRPDFKLSSSLSTEAQLRDERIKAYKELKGDVVVCHHLNDCVESYLMNCLKGQAEFLPLPLKTELDNGFHIYRPFLITYKRDFISQVTGFSLDNFVVEDPTNKDTAYKRNWVRNDLIPYLETNGQHLEVIVRKKMMSAYDRENPPQR